MSQVLPMIAVVLYGLIGLVSLLMAYKNLSRVGFLPFHEQAAGRRWEEVDAGLQSVVTALMRIMGLGFAMVGLQLVTLPLVGLMTNDRLPVLVAAIAGFLFCFGLFVTNYWLKTQTGAETPWQGSLYAALVILVATALSFLRI